MKNKENKTKNIALLINKFFEKEVGNVTGSDITYKGKNAFLFQVKNKEVEVETILYIKSKV